MTISINVLPGVGAEILGVDIAGGFRGTRDYPTDIFAVRSGFFQRPANVRN